MGTWRKENVQEYYVALGKFFDAVGDYRMNALHAGKAGKPAGLRNPFYDSATAKAGWQYERDAHRFHLLASLRWADAEKIYSTGRGKTFPIDEQEFVSRFVNPDAEDGDRIGYNALVWFKKTVHRLALTADEILDPITIRLKFYQRKHDPLEWFSCCVAPATSPKEEKYEQLTFNLNDYCPPPYRG